MAQADRNGNTSAGSVDHRFRCESVHCEVSEIYEVSIKNRTYVVEVHPMNESLFKRWIRSTSVAGRHGFKDYLRYKAAYPHNTHIRYRRMKGSSDIEFQGANPLALCRPIGGRLIERKVHLNDEAGITCVLSPDDAQLVDLGWKIYVGENGYYAVNEQSLRQSLACPDPAGAEATAWLIQNHLSENRGVEGQRIGSGPKVFAELKFDLGIVLTRAKSKPSGKATVTVVAQRVPGRLVYSRKIEAGPASDLLDVLSAAVESLT